MKPVNATKDFLTNCYTREGIQPFLKRLEEDFAVNKRPFAVLIMDVDHFKTFNDKFGHLYGDEVLKYFSSSMRLDLEDEENAPFRFGGDEFIMVFPHKSASDGARLANRLRKNMRTRSCLIKGHQISVTFSGGIACYPVDASTIDDLLERADKALYYSKNHGRGRITKFSELAHKELIQIGIIIAILVTIAAGLFVFRDGMSRQFKTVESLVAKFSKTLTLPTSPIKMMPVPDTGTNPTTAPTTVIVVDPASPTLPQPPQPSEPVEAVGPAKTKLFLESGRVVEGVVKSEDDLVIKIEVRLSEEGKAVLNIKKTQVLRREPPQSL